MASTSNQAVHVSIIAIISISSLLKWQGLTGGGKIDAPFSMNACPDCKHTHLLPKLFCKLLPKKNLHLA